MALFGKKKSYKFEINVGLEELNAVPFVNGVLFAKLRLINVRHSSQFSSREEILDHRVVWHSNHVFQCKMFANPTSSILEPQELKISIRQEMKGGKSYHKLGYATINTACFAGLGGVASRRRYLLEGYNEKKKRQDNSMLQVNFAVRLLLGDNCYRVPEEDLTRSIPYDTTSTPRVTEEEEETEDSSPVHQEDTRRASSQRYTETGDSSDEDPPSRLSSPIAKHTERPTSLADSPSHAPVPPAMPVTASTWPQCRHCGHSTTPHHTQDPSIQVCTCSEDAPCLPSPAANDAPSITAYQRHRRHQSAMTGGTLALSLAGPTAVCSSCTTTSSSGYRTHSRQSSLDSASQFNKLEFQIRKGGSVFSCSSTSINNDVKSLDRKRERKQPESDNVKQQQLDSTRLDNDEIVSQILNS